MAKANYTRPADEVSLEAALKLEANPVSPEDSVLATGDGNDTSGFVGVDPSYRNYADETYRPFIADDDSMVSQYEARAAAELAEINDPAVVEADVEPEAEKPKTTKSNPSAPTV